VVRRSSSSAAALAACEAVNDDGEEGDDGVDDGFDTGGDGVDDGHDAVADRAEDGLDLCSVSRLPLDWRWETYARYYGAHFCDCVVVFELCG
jgi:hypothetical protein